ncbi:hypothetical protein C2E21_7222 [Chlorella sorokiniana]|uniref:Uncharacterized protein n=1 Tax=Chlorella sorokiniana TaxID=3076 RepID=A0A2P6TIA1_CHLSO|nr:hypothetical protein C2E21_7222 [Chlorella sorokiniana]|eukprot:PRW33996.1 hypothetical protein C2E21_7222 [Chlorella sorokiniana]
MAAEQCEEASSADALVESVLALPSPLAARIGAAAEALSPLDFCGQFPVDCRLVAQAYRQASLLGSVQRETARAAPLCVLVDIEALKQPWGPVRRPQALAACLRWLLGLPNLRAVRFANGGKGGMLGEEELGLLLQLVAAHPEAAAGLQHIDISTQELGRQFDAGLLGPLTRLRSLKLYWYSTADLSGLPPSVLSVEMRLPGSNFRLYRITAGLPPAAGEGAAEMLPPAVQVTVERIAFGPLADMGQALQGLAPDEGIFAENPTAAAILQTLQQLQADYAALGHVAPISQPPRHSLDQLTIDADGMNMSLSAGLLFGAARSLAVTRGGRVRLLLPQPALPGGRAMSVRVLFLMAAAAYGADAAAGPGPGPAALPGPAAPISSERLAFPMSVACAEALLDAFRAAPNLATAHLGGRKWTVGLAGYCTGVQLHPAELLDFVRVVQRSCPERFGYLRAAAAPEPFSTEPPPLLLSRSAVDSLVIGRAASSCRGASKALGAVLACWAAGLGLGPALGLLPFTPRLGLLSSSTRAWVRFGKAAAVLGIPALLLGSLAQQLDTL